MVFFIIINMEGQEQRLDEISLRELFSKIRSSKDAYLLFLKQRNLVRFCNEHEFLDHVTKVAQKTNLLPPNFKQQFESVNHKYQDEKYRDFVYPLITSNEHEFEERSISLFVTQFYQSSLAQQKARINQKQSLKKQKKKALSDDERNRLKVVVSIHQKAQPAITIQKIQKQQEAGLPSPIKMQKEDDDFFDSPLHQQIAQKKTPQKEGKHKLPQNLHNQFCNERYFSSLMALNVSNEFRNQFQEVKEMIKSQLVSKDTRTQKAYENFLKEYLIFNKISEGCCERNMDQEYFIRKLKQSGTDQTKVLKEVWDSLKQNISQQDLFIKENNMNLIDILTEGLNDSYLTFQLLKMPYGVTVYDGIFVNINQACWQQMSLNSYRNGPLKSYIALTLYHELAHYLIRKHSQIRLNETSSSFEHKQNTIGSTFLQIIKEKMYQKPKWIKLESKNDEKSKVCLKTSIELEEKISAFKEKYSKEIILLAEHKNQLKDISTDIKEFCIPFQASQLKQNLKLIKESQWHQIFSYINSLDSDEYPKEFLWSNNQQIKYQFFFSLLLLSENITNQIFCERIQLSQILVDCQKKLQKLSKIQQYKFFRGNVQGIKKFITRIKNEQFNLIQMQQFSLHVLIQGKRIRFSSKEIQSIEQSFPQSIIKAFKYEIAQLFELASQLFKIEDNPAVKDLKVELKMLQLQTINFCLIFNAEQAFSRLIQLEQFLGVFKIVVELPTFYYIADENNDQRQYQSGFDMEKRLFGRNNISHIYAKDFQLMKDIDKNWRLIGVEPQEQAQKILKVSIEKSGKTSCQSFISVQKIGCGVYHKNKAWIQAKKDLIEIEKLKAEEQRLKQISEEGEEDLQPHL